MKMDVSEEELRDVALDLFFDQFGEDIKKIKKKMIDTAYEAWGADGDSKTVSDYISRVVDDAFSNISGKFEQRTPFSSR